MRHDRSPAMQVLFVLSLLIAIIPLMVMSKDEESKKEVTQRESVAEMTHDSALAIINTEFVKLEPIFKRGCFDCHSNQTRFPWYYRLPLIKTIIERDINRARTRIIFSHGFPFEGTGSQKENLLDLKDVLEEGEMPLWSYRLLHWDAAPTAIEKDSIFAWIERSLILMDSTGSSEKK